MLPDGVAAAASLIRGLLQVGDGARSRPRRSSSDRRDDVHRDVPGVRIVFQLIEHHPAVHVGQAQVEGDGVGLQACAPAPGPGRRWSATTPRKPRSRAKPSKVRPKVSSSSIISSTRSPEAGCACRSSDSGPLPPARIEAAWPRPDGVAAPAAGSAGAHGGHRLERRPGRRGRPASCASAHPDRELERQNRVKRAAHPRLAVQVQLAAEQVGDLAADGQAQAGAAVLAAGAAVGLLERLEDDLLLVLGDADAGVDRPRSRSPCRRCSATRCRRSTRADRRRKIRRRHAAPFGELERVRQQVAQHLAQPHVVGPDVPRAEPESSSIVKLELLLLGHVAERAIDVVLQLAEAAPSPTSTAMVPDSILARSRISLISASRSAPDWWMVRGELDLLGGQVAARGCPPAGATGSAGC